MAEVLPILRGELPLPAPFRQSDKFSGTILSRHGIVRSRTQTMEFFNISHHAGFGKKSLMACPDIVCPETMRKSFYHSCPCSDSWLEPFLVITSEEIHHHSSMNSSFISRVVLLVEVHGAERRRGSHIFYTIDSQIEARLTALRNGMPSFVPTKNSGINFRYRLNRPQGHSSDKN
jgi:hypothetical protein